MIFSPLIQVPIFKRLIPSIVKRYFKLIGKNNFIINYENINIIINLNEPMDQLIYFQNNYEKKQINFLLKKIKTIKPNFFIDVGANSGIYSLFVGKNFPTIKVFAFEPNKKTFKILAKNISINNLKNKIKIFNIGLSHKIGELKMKALIKNNYIQKGGFAVADKDEDLHFLHRETAKFITGDSKLNIKNKKIFLKIDVEGHEFYALEGFQKLLKNNSIFLQIEIFDKNFKKINSLLKKNHFKLVNSIFSDNKTDYFYSNF